MEKKIAKIFGLDGDEWLKHANPWSIWTRFIVLPFLALSIWSREWIGMYCLIPVTLLVIWILINPRFFKVPKTTDNWSSKCVLGEKMWSNRDDIEVPVHHMLIIKILTFIQSIGGLVMFVGLYQLHFYLTVLGIVIIYLSKMWFLDRMVWIFEDMQNEPAYKEFLY